VIIAGIVALLVIFIRGSFDAGEPIDTIVALVSIGALGVLSRLWERTAHHLVRARRA
jgi:hypothetical protein